MLYNIIKKTLKEATLGKSKGSYVSPLQPGYREFESHMNGPFTEYVTNWDDPSLDYDSLDGRMSVSKKTAKKREKKAEKIANFIKNNPDSVAQDNDGGLLNGGPGKNTDAKPIKNFNPKKTVTKLGEWVNLDSETLNEDLAVWFGTKKKPKGSKQPKGPWVNICRKVDGKHPPCGRSNTDKGGYPKCRAAGVAGKMSDSEKKAACQQKRSAEKKDTQTGKGQKPIMTSYKKKKTNEDMKRIVSLTENDINKLVKKILNEQNEPPLNCDWFMMDTNLLDGQKGEIQIMRLDNNGNWRLQKTTNNTTRPVIVNLTVPQKNQLQVSWDSANKRIVLSGPSLIGMRSYNTLFNENTTEQDCKVLYEIQTNEGPQLVQGTIKLKKQENQPNIGNMVRLQDGATLTFGNYFSGRKRNLQDEKSLGLRRLFGTLEIEGDQYKFNGLQKKCP